MKKQTTVLAIVALVAATIGLGIATSVNMASAASASGNGALGHVGECHKIVESTGATHQDAVRTCGPI